MIKYNNQGFTLIEVIIALTVLSVAMLGLYTMLNQSLNVAIYGKDKLYVIEKGYERIVRENVYPRIPLSETETDNNKEISYEYKRTSTVIPGVTQVTVTTKIDSAEAVYVYFEKK